MIPDLASVDEIQRTAPSQILRAALGAVLTDTAVDIHGDAGVERARTGADHVHGPRTHFRSLSTKAECAIENVACARC
jgi:hypothetical protein